MPAYSVTLGSDGQLVNYNYWLLTKSLTKLVVVKLMLFSQLPITGYATGIGLRADVFRGSLCFEMRSGNRDRL